MIRHTSRTRRPAAIAVEMAILLPLILFMAAIGVDYARIFSRTAVMETAARNGCLYAAQDSTKAADTTGIQAVAQQDLTDVSPTPSVSSSVTTGSDGFKYVTVTVSMTFTTVMNVPGVPSSTAVSRSVTMRVCPTTPKPGTY